MMAAQLYPIGIQSFPTIIEEGFTYVDKTRLVAILITEGRYIFLSRPRRFGKSLLLSTIHTFFDGRRDLFKGLAIDNMEMDWTPHPVLHFDLNSGFYDRPDGLEDRLRTHLARYEQDYGLATPENLDPALRFENLIRNIYKKTGRKVVVLVDEYDKPLLGLEEDTNLYEKNQRMLKGFFSNLKSMDPYIRFAMLTGVARFSKVSIFSDMNNLEDISMTEEYQEICGLTEEELVSNFRPGIEALAERHHITTDETIGKLRRFYDGYLFSEVGNRLYNPFSVLRALKAKEIRPYWFETGTPTFLAKKIKKSGVDPELINGKTCDYEELIAVGSGTGNIIALMFQTGYLTVDSFDSRRQRYALRFPNREVEIGFAKNLLPLYAPQTNRPDAPFNLHYFQDDLFDGHPDAFMDRLAALLKGFPYEDQGEKTFRAITYLLCLLSGTEAVPERHSYRGRSDLEVLTPDFIYVFEFKYDRSLREAADQLRERDYAGRFALDSRPLFLIAANLSVNDRSRELQYEIINRNSSQK